jgi:hypothetical protein
MLFFSFTKSENRRAGWVLLGGCWYQWKEEEMGKGAKES